MSLYFFGFRDGWDCVSYAERERVSHRGSRGEWQARKVGVINQSAAEEPLRGGERPKSEQPARAGRWRIGPRRNWIYGVAIVVTLSGKSSSLGRSVPLPGIRETENKINRDAR